MKGTRQKNKWQAEKYDPGSDMNKDCQYFGFHLFLCTVYDVQITIFFSLPIEMISFFMTLVIR